MSQDRLEALLSFYEEDPRDAFTRFAIAREYLKRDETEKALAFFEGLVEEDPDYVGTYYHLGKLYERLGRTSEAVRTYGRGIQVAQARRDAHARAELQDALMSAQGIGSDEEDEG